MRPTPPGKGEYEADLRQLDQGTAEQNGQRIWKGDDRGPESNGCRGARPGGGRKRGASCRRPSRAGRSPAAVTGRATSSVITISGSGTPGMGGSGAAAAAASVAAGDTG